MHHIVLSNCTIIIMAAAVFPAMAWAQEQAVDVPLPEDVAQEAPSNSGLSESDELSSELASELAELTLTDLLSRKVVTESRTEASLDDVISTVRVISREEILLYVYRDLPDVLRHTLGIDYIQPASWLNGGFRGRPGTWVDVKFLINGHEVNLLWSGEAFLSNQFLLNNVEQVEILFGPASSVYGADAMSGVVNIITREHPEFGTRTSLYVSGSSQYRKEVGFSASITGPRVRLNFSGAAMQSQGPDFTDFVLSPEYDGNSEARQRNFASGFESYHDANEGYRIHTELEAQLAAGQKLILGGFWLKNTDGNGQESLSNLLNSEDARQRQLGIRTSYEMDLREAFSLPIDTTIRATYKYTTDTVQFNWTSGFPDPGLLNVWNVEDSRQHSLTLFSTTNFERIDNRLIAGFEYEKLHIAPIQFTGFTDNDVLTYDDGDTISVVGRVLFPATADFFAYLEDYSQQDLTGVFIQDEQQLGSALKAVAGARFDHSNQYGNVLNVRSGLRWRPFESVAARLSYNEAFAGPTIFDLSLGQNLKPVRLRTGEVGAQAILSDRVAIQVSGFWNHFSDLLVDEFMGGDFARVNRGSETVFGSEAELRWHVGPLSGYVGMSYVTDDDGNAPLHASPFKLIGRMSWNAWENLFLTVDTKYTSEITTVRNPPPGSTPEDVDQTIDSYRLVNLGLIMKSVEISPVSDLTISATVRNVFDFDNRFPNHRGTTPFAFAEEPRSVFVRAEINMF